MNAMEYKAKKNHEIVEHLRLRFKERYNIELNRDRRIKLLNQIQKNIGSLTAKLPSGAELWRVAMYNQESYSDQHFTVLYDRSMGQITTVLPPTDSEEFQEFCDKVNIQKEQLVSQRLTAREKTMESVNRVAEIRMQKAIEKESLQRLKKHKVIADYFKQH